MEKFYRWLRDDLSEANFAEGIRAAFGQRPTVQVSEVNCLKIGAVA